MDITTYALSKKIAAHAVSGVQSMSVSGQTLTINTKDSGVLTMTFPTPKDGVSVTDIDVNANNQIVFTMSDGTEFISGKIPTVKGDKGEPFKYSDFTQEQLEALKGADGFSPSAKVEKVGDTATITITDKDGTTTATIKDGQGGSGGTGEENTIDSISVNGVNVVPDENKNVDITVPNIYVGDTEPIDDNMEVWFNPNGESSSIDVPIEKIKVNGELQIPVNKVVDITVPSIEGLAKTEDIPTNISELTNDSGYLTEHQDISGKVDKVEGKSLISDTEIARLATVDNYDDTQVKTQIQTVANGLMDSVGYSADYKTIDIIAKNGVKKSVNVAPIISHASITELSDVDTTNKATGKALVYNATTNKHEYADVSRTDEKVKMDASTDAKYLGELLDNVTIANENGELKVKKLDGQEVTITEINYLKGLTMNVMDLVNMFSNGGVKIINTPVATYAELLTLDKSSFIEGISYLVYVLADENHDNAKTTYLVDKDSETPTYFGFADSQRDFITNPIDLATEITGKLGISNMDSDAIKALFTVDDTYKTETATNNAFSTHGAKALYDELLLAIGNKANDSDLTAHKDDTDIHVSTEDRTKWDKVVDKVDKIEGKGLSANDYTDEEKSLVATIEDKVDKSSIVTALDDTVTDEQVASALLAKTELDKKIDKTSIVTELSDTSTDDEVVGALTAYNELQKLESANKEQFATANGDYITVNDSVDGNIVELGIKGNSFQQSYTGKNILHNVLNPTYNYTGTDGSTITTIVDGDVITVTNTEKTGGGFSNHYAWTWASKEENLIDISKYIGQKLTFSINVISGSITQRWIGFWVLSYKNITDSSTNAIYLYNNPSSLSPKGLYNCGTLEITQDFIDTNGKYIGVNYWISNNNIHTDFKFRTQIEVGDTATKYEPYVGGIPAPSPLYPQAINSVGDDGSLVVKSCRKNLIPYPYHRPSGFKYGGITFDILDDLSTHYYGTATTRIWYMLGNNNIQLKAGHKYLFSIDKIVGDKSYVYFIDRSSGSDVWRVLNYSRNKIAFTQNLDTIISIGIQIADGGTVDETVKIMLQECDESGNPIEGEGYEPYKSSTSTISLSDPLRAIGDVKDEITYQDGKLSMLRRIGKYVIDGTENLVLDSAHIADCGISVKMGNYTNILNGISVVSRNTRDMVTDYLGCRELDHIPYYDSSSTIDRGSGIYRTSDNIWLSFGASDIEKMGITKDIDSVKTWLSSHNITVHYPLGTPVFEPFADQTLPYLSTYDGVTNISTDDALSAEMTVKYPTTDASGVGSRNESRIAELDKNKVDKSSVVTSLNSDSTDKQVPSAKAVYDKYKGTIYRDEDLDLITETGLYVCIGGDTYGETNHFPVLDNGYLYHANFPAEGYCTQIFIPNGVWGGDLSQYIRRQKGGTWTNWVRNCNTTVADSSGTVTLPDGITGVISYKVVNGICYVSIQGLADGLTGTQVCTFTGLPKADIYINIGIEYLGNRVGTIYTDDGVTFYVHKTTTNSGYGSFSYPVAES